MGAKSESLPVGGREVSPTNTLPQGGVEVSPEVEGWNWKFENIGDQLIGTVVEFRPFRNGHKCKIVTDGGEVRLFSAATNLAEKLALVPLGHRVGIQLIEERPGTNGKNPFKVFRVVNYGRSR